MLPQTSGGETDRLTGELYQIEATLKDLQSRKRPLGEVLTPATKRSRSER